MAVGKMYKGEEFLFLVELTNDDGTKIVRPFDQTGGSTSLSADEIEVDTKDRSGTDYGNVTQTISLEGNLTEGDPFIPFIKKAIRTKQFVKIFEVNTRTLDAEYGSYMVNSFDRDFGNGDNATYSLSGTLFGEVCETKLNRVPDGAPASADGASCEPEINIPEDGGEVEGYGIGEAAIGESFEVQ